MQVNPHTHQLKLCDFGSAKALVWLGVDELKYLSVSNILIAMIWLISISFWTMHKKNWSLVICNNRSKESQIYHIFVLDIIVHLNSYSGQLNTQLQLTQVYFIRFCTWSRTITVYMRITYLQSSYAPSDSLASISRWEWSWSACWNNQGNLPGPHA